MCGIVGLLLADETANVNQLLFDGLTVLQHRGQDAAGMVTAKNCRLHLRKENGLVKDVFFRHHMLELTGNVGLGHVRYPTAGSSSCAEAQPLYSNYPYGICVAHNGNLINADELTDQLRKDGRHVNTDSDSELLLNIFAEALTRQGGVLPPSSCSTSSSSNANNTAPVSNGNHEPNIKDCIFQAITSVMEQCKGGYSGMYLINGVGLVGFRDPHGIRPMVYGQRKSTTVEGKMDFVIASESVAIDTLGFELVRDIRAGEAIFFDMNTGHYYSRQCHTDARPAPCIFEYVYFARPDSIMDGISVYETRLKMGETLAENIMRRHPDHSIDVVIPIPDTSRTAALQAAYRLNRPFREGFIKNRYIARTFIMPGQATRKKSVRLKLNTIKSEFMGKNVLLVDDSIVRGTTAREIVQMAREAGARRVFFSSAAPPIRYPNIYGIDIPTRQELMAFERNEDEIAEKIGCDWIVYQELKDLEHAVSSCSPPNHLVDSFDTSCFSGIYVTGENVNDSYFTLLHDRRNDDAKQRRESQLDNNTAATINECESVANDKRPPMHTSNSCESLSNQPTLVVR